MPRRKLLVALAGLAVAVAAGAVVLWPRPSSRVTRENYQRVHREGHVGGTMSTNYNGTRAAVEAVLGPPTSDSAVLVDVGEDQRMPCRLLEWEGDAIEVYATATTGGLVFRLRTEQLSPGERTPLSRLTRLAKRQWHRWFPE
jgi:hypothetical protein